MSEINVKLGKKATDVLKELVEGSGIEEQDRVIESVLLTMKELIDLTMEKRSSSNVATVSADRFVGVISTFTRFMKKAYT